jgi:hypothetical protein
LIVCGKDLEKRLITGKIPFFSVLSLLSKKQHGLKTKFHQILNSSLFHFQDEGDRCGERPKAHEAT